MGNLGMLGYLAKRLLRHLGMARGNSTKERRDSRYNRSSDVGSDPTVQSVQGRARPGVSGVQGQDMSVSTRGVEDVTASLQNLRHQEMRRGPPRPKEDGLTG